MNFKKRANGSWVDTPNYIHNTSTDTIATLPAVLYPNGATATVGLKGNTVQNGTPSPSNPIIPEGVGEMTSNLVPPLSKWIKGYLRMDGTIEPVEPHGEKTSDYIPISENTVYTYSRVNGFPDSSGEQAWRALCFFDNNKNMIGVRIAEYSSDSLTVVAPSNTAYCRLSYRTFNEAYQPQLNVGSTVLIYEPYGYKIPISSANTTTPVYLGEVQTTRKVKKLVLTGEEAIEIKSGNAKWYIPIADMKTPTNTSVIEWYCSHYQAIANSASWASYDYMISWSTADSGTSIGLRIRDIDFLTEVTVSDFKTYLQQQYANGTPVTVWYVLAEPTTGIVNEPLRKIGDYADEVSGISIPTIAGANTISVDTTLQPSEVTVNYKGWHPVQSVHEAENGHWD